MDSIFFEDVEWKWHKNSIELDSNYNHICEAEIIEKADDWGPEFFIKVIKVVKPFI